MSILKYSVPEYIKNDIELIKKAIDNTSIEKIKDIEKRLKGFKEKGQFGSGFINAGCYVLKRESLRYFPSKK